jgi:organic hydroperoxide reductase OsmC/OhrA
MRITHVTVRPRIVVGEDADCGRVARLIERAHDGCFIANTLNAEIDVQPVVQLGRADAASTATAEQT